MGSLASKKRSGFVYSLISFQIYSMDLSKGWRSQDWMISDSPISPQFWNEDGDTMKSSSVHMPNFGHEQSDMRGTHIEEVSNTYLYIRVSKLT